MHAKAKAAGALCLALAALAILTDFAYTNLSRQGLCYRAYRALRSAAAGWMARQDAAPARAALRAHAPLKEARGGGYGMPGIRSSRTRAAA